MPAEKMLYADVIPAARDLSLDPILAHFAEHGYARLGRVLDDHGLAELRRRVDDLMHGRLEYPGMFFQRDSETGSYDDLVFKRGYEGPGDNYRKLEKLELDPAFREWMRNPLYERIARRVVDGDGGIALYRAVVFNKSKTGGTELPWHQDGGRFWGLDRDPILQIWTGLDDASVNAGCIELIPRTHLAGLRTPFGGSIPNQVIDEMRAAFGSACDPIFVPTVAGEALLIHNHVWHRSGINRGGQPRRALSFCYMSDQTRCTRKKRSPRSFFQVFPAR